MCFVSGGCSWLRLPDAGAGAGEAQYLRHATNTDILLEPQGAIYLGSNSPRKGCVYYLVPEVPLFRVMLMRPRAFLGMPSVSGLHSYESNMYLPNSLATNRGLSCGVMVKVLDCGIRLTKGLVSYLSSWWYI